MNTKAVELWKRQANSAKWWRGWSSCLRRRDERVGLLLREGKAERRLSEVYQVTEVVDKLNEELLFTHTCIVRHR